MRVTEPRGQALKYFFPFIEYIYWQTLSAVIGRNVKFSPGLLSRHSDTVLHRICHLKSCNPVRALN